MISKRNYMFHLPPELISLIYEYAGNPFKDQYKKVLFEFELISTVINKKKKLVWDGYDCYFCFNSNRDHKLYYLFRPPSRRDTKRPKKTFLKLDKILEEYMRVVNYYGLQNYLHLEREKKEEWQREMEEEWQREYEYYKNIYSECIKTLK
jgi:hypothetical protein